MPARASARGDSWSVAVALALALLLADCGGGSATTDAGGGGSTSSVGAAGSSGAAGTSGVAGTGGAGGSATTAGATGTGGAVAGTTGAAGTTGGGAGGGSAGLGGDGGRTGGRGGTNATAGRGGIGGATGGSTAGTGGAGGAAAGGAAGLGGGRAGTTGGGGAISCSGKTAPAGETTRTIQIGGTSRTYILHVPSTYSGATAVPLVLDFHALGGTGSSEKSSSGFAALSDRDGFVIAWPNGIDNAWNIGPCCTNSRTVDDLGFARGMVDEIEKLACIDVKRVYSTGFSMGGGMSHYLACNAADVFAAVAPSSFDLLIDSEEPCMPSRPISVLSFRGTSDTVVPYAGGAGSSGRVHFLGAVGTLMKWAQLDMCTGSPTTSGSEQLYTQCAAGVEVGLYTIDGGGHAPGPAGTAWDFLKAKTLP
jgi:polyhydroxybutyrate depolymerase